MRWAADRAAGRFDVLRLVRQDRDATRQDVFVIALMIGLLLVVALVKLRTRGKRKAMQYAPLAGFDTGCRFGRRTPGRFFKPSRGY